MASFIQSQLIFYITLASVLFLPGYALLYVIFGKNKTLGNLERFVFSFGLSATILNFILFAIQKSGFLISKTSILASLAIFLIVCMGIYLKRADKADVADKNDKLFDFSQKQFWLIIILLGFTFLIKTTYLANTIIPTSTDMGHHMYWSKLLSQTGTLPTYDGMPDFIIGEHTLFGVVNILSGADYFSAFPIVVLYSVNILSILAVFILALRIFKNKNVAILALLFLGVIYAISSPQAKFVSGGVIGNILGNYYLPVIFYFYFRAFEFLLDKNLKPNFSKTFLCLAIFLSFGLFYTHHLSSFVFLFVFILLIVLFLVLNFKQLEEIFPKAMKIVFSWPVILTMVGCLIFFFFVFTPTYISGSAVDTAVGSPVKATRTGMSLANVQSTVGDPRMALAIVGLVLLGFFYQKRNFGFAIISAWAIMLFIMSTKPSWLFVDIPSNRIGNYLTYPVVILSAYGFWVVFQNLKINNLVRLGYFLLLIFALTWGLRDSALALKEVANSAELSQTFGAAKYLAQNSDNNDKVLKDHNYLTGDSWIKLFFMRGYKYPDSRGYFKRYDDPTNPREMCTLYMISEPGSENGKNCYTEVGTNFLMVNPNFDRGQFLKLDNFDQIYSNSNVAVFYRKNN